MPQSWEPAFVLGLLACVVALFATDRFRMDGIAVAALVALALSGVLTPAEALAGFGAPVTVLIAALFVVGAALSRTGIAGAVGGWIADRGGDRPMRLLLLMMAAAAGLSAFMSSTGAVAVFIPIALDLAARSGTSPARLLMPLAFAAMIGGMLTLIGTPPNLIVNAALLEAGLAPFGFFAFTPVGLAVFVAAAALLLTVGVRLLARQPFAVKPPRRLPSGADLLRAHGLDAEIVRLRVAADSPLAGRSLGESELDARAGLIPIGLHRAGAAGPVSARDATTPEAGDVLVARLAPGGDPAPAGLGLTPDSGSLTLDGAARDGLGLVEAVVRPDSDLVAHRALAADLPARVGLTPLSINRRREAAEGADAPLEAGDVALMAGSWESVRALVSASDDFVTLRTPREYEADPPAREKAPVALAITAATLAALTLQLAPSVIVALVAALALTLTRCLSAADAYRAVNWQSIVLIAGMLPMATALETSGALALMVDGLTSALAEAGPLALLAALMALTSALSQVISNTATAVLIAPVAMASAARLGVDPQPLLLGVAVAASTAFSTPVASPVNTLVLGPGGYRFSDFLKVGLSIQIAALATAFVAILALYPL